jgi:Flp pilus assembly pilin Flp
MPAATPRDAGVEETAERLAILRMIRTRTQVLLARQFQDAGEAAPKTFSAIREWWSTFSAKAGAALQSERNQPEAELRPCCSAGMPLTEENVNYLPMLTSLAGRLMLPDSHSSGNLDEMEYWLWWRRKIVFQRIVSINDSEESTIMKTLLFNFVKDEQGQDLIEYTLLLAFVCLASAALFISVGGSVGGIWTQANTRLTAANTAAAS